MKIKKKYDTLQVWNSGKNNKVIQIVYSNPSCPGVNATSIVLGPTQAKRLAKFLESK